MKTVTTLPLLLIIRGLPGSGKTHIAEVLAKEFEPDAVLSLDPDTINYDSDEFKQHVQDQIAEGVDPILHDYRFLRAKAYKAIESRKIIIWNQPFTNLDMLQKVTNRLKEHASENSLNLTIIITEVNIDPEIARQRIISRISQGGHGPDDERFNRFIKEYETAKSLGYKTILVNGSEDVNLAVNKILDNLS
jgi:predicted ABC-type ATPase